MTEYKEYVTMSQSHPFFCRWWLKVREVEPIIHEDGLISACHEFYIPFWAWPLESLHRFIWFLKGSSI